MKDIKVGDFVIKISEPYPMWINIYYKGQSLGGIHHQELSDLDYAVKKAIQAAELKLPGEVDINKRGEK